MTKSCFKIWRLKTKQKAYIFPLLLLTVITLLLTSCAKGDGPAFEGLRAGMRMEEVEEAWGISLADWTEEDDPDELLRSFYSPGERFTLPESGKAVGEVKLEFSYDSDDADKPVGLHRLVLWFSDVSASQEYYSHLVEEYGEPREEGIKFRWKYPPDGKSLTILYMPPGVLPDQPLYDVFSVKFPYPYQPAPIYGYDPYAREPYNPLGQ